jgi:hypothetical protein
MRLGKLTLQLLPLDFVSREPKDDEPAGNSALTNQQVGGGVIGHRLHHPARQVAQ